MENAAQAKLEKLVIPLISLVILTFISLQIYTARGTRDILPERRSISLLKKKLIPPEPPTLWPFLDYPMYSNAKFAGDKINQYFVFGIIEDSTEIQILPEDLGLNSWLFLGHFVKALRKDDYEHIKKFADLYESRHSKKLLRLRLETHSLVLSKEGVIKRSPLQKDIQLEKIGE